MNPFKKLTILALEQATVVPYLTFRMVQDGMRVIRIEHPLYGDPNRNVGDDVLGEPGMGSYFLGINAGKEAVTLNLADPEGKKILTELIRKLPVDMFVTNQLPRNYEKLGIAYEILQEIRPEIIWMGITGFGPDSNEAAYDPILQARSGLMDLTGSPDGEPQVLGIPLPDMGASEHAYGLLMKALYQREATGKGSRIDLSMFESTVSWLTVPLSIYGSFGKIMTRRGNTHEFFAPVSVYPAADGYIYIAVGNDRQWKSIVSQPIFQSLDDPEYKKNSGRIRDVKNLNRKIENITRNHTSGELIDLFRKITVPVARIHSIPEVMNDPLVKKKLLFSTDPGKGMEIVMAPPPIMTPFLQESNRRLGFPPRLGEHNGKILGAIGYSKKQIEQFRENGVI